MQRHDTGALRTVAYVDLARQAAEDEVELIACARRIFASADFILGGAVAELEAQLAEYIGVPHVVGVASGTDALIIAMRALGLKPGDEVITPPNSFVASTSAIVLAGATPVFADVQPDQNIDPAAVERAISPRTRAIMPVHLTGRIAAMEPLLALAEKHGLAVIEDAAQAIGSRYKGHGSGSMGHAGCFSAHPLKNLSALGDAGFITTHDGGLADKARILRNIGMRDRDTAVEWAGVARLDTLQAEFLKMRLRHLPAVIERRRANAALYRQLLDPSHVFAPPCRDYEFNTFHTFVVQVDRRNALRAHLAEGGIATAVHYPTPIHLQPAARPLGYGEGDFPVTETQAARILTLPVHQCLGEADISHVAQTINRFYT
jgi:dTDP-4-amino-4,6-dideoxygalactose transaminase